MNSGSLENILQKLSQSRPIFHSEADFQFSLASAIKEAYPTAEIRLERPFPHYREGHQTIYLDILVILDGRLYPIELKYKTLALNPTPCVINNEVFQLKNQGARDQGVYYCLKDVERLENLALQPNFEMGFTIWLTNDPIYWREPANSQANFAEFSLHNGAIKQQEMCWPNGKLKGEKIRLNGCYPIFWQKYSSNLKTDSGETIGKSDFRYVLLAITK